METRHEIKVFDEGCSQESLDGEKINCEGAEEGHEIVETEDTLVVEATEENPQ